MSRDWTPKEFDMISKSMGQEVCPIIDMVWCKNGESYEEGTPLYTDEEKEKIKSLPNLSRIGIDVLSECLRNGVYSSDKGRAILQQLEDYFGSGVEIPDKELAETAKLWYEGQLVLGRYMDENNDEFVRFLRRKSKE